MKIILNTVFLCLSVMPNFLFAQQSPDSIPAHQSFTLQSKHVNELRVLNVWLPSEYSSDSLTVLYMLDGGVQEDFPHLANTLADLIKLKKIKPVILVGIENTQRRRDLTGVTTVKKDKAIAPVVGGSEQFRAFISDELIPEINKRYKTSTKKGLLGESLAGLFVTETLLLRPELFDFYIAFDPSLWWNNKHLVKTAEEHLSKFPKARKTFWFAGSDAKDIYKNTEKLVKVLKEKSPETLTWIYLPEPKEQHGTIFRATKEKALIWTLNN